MNLTPSLAAAGGFLFLSLPTSALGGIDGDSCTATAHLQLQGTRLEDRGALLLAYASCLNLTDAGEAAECRREARLDFVDAMQLANDQFDARLALCGLLGGGAYDPAIDAAAFTTRVDNPLLPFPVGATWTYESETDEGKETIEIEVLDETREILGVECITVRDTVSIDGELLEDTYDWYAQDAAGNVWYFGEISFNYSDGWVEDVDGSWLAGVEGAKPGIVMPAVPTPGETYRQEWWLNEAEDAATVLMDDATVSIALGTFSGCVQTADFLPPEPTALEHKFYAPGIGFVYETKPGSDETVELVAFAGL